MVVTVITMRMMQMTIDDVAGMIAMWYCLVTTVRTMDMITVMTLAMMLWRTAIGVGRCDC